MRREEKKAMMQVALAYVGENLYRAVARWMDADADRVLNGSVHWLLRRFSCRSAVTPVCSAKSKRGAF